jgi:hypothetical protein
MPFFINALAMTSETSAASVESILGRISIIVTLLPKELNIFANSEPITPPPTISRDSGTSVRESTPILSIIPLPSRINGGTLPA